MPRRVIVDADVGLDDYLAMCILLSAEKRGEIKIEAITCTTGNTTIENVVRNTMRMLEVFGRTDIPVFKGVSTQIIPCDHVCTFHGNDGFADLDLWEPDVSKVQEKLSPVAMYDLAKENPGEIDLMCLAPLTNVALAVRLFDDFAKLIKGVYIMGGNFAGVGNTSCSAEFNFYIDPEAAFIVLDSFKCPISIVAWETSISASLPSDWRYNTLGKISNPIMDLLNKAEKALKWDLKDEWRTPDALTAIAYVYPEISKEKVSQHNATVELQGLYTRGALILDHLKKKQPNVEIIELMNLEFIQAALIETAETMGKIGK